MCSTEVLEPRAGPTSATRPRMSLRSLMRSPAEWQVQTLSQGPPDRHVCHCSCHKRSDLQQGLAHPDSVQLVHDRAVAAELVTCTSFATARSTPGLFRPSA